MHTLLSAALLAGPAAADDTFDLEGTWALRMDTVTAAKVVVVGELESDSSTWIRIQASRDGDGWVQDHRVCGAAVTGGLVKTRIPPAFLEAVPTKRYPVTLEPSDGGLRYFADTEKYVVGFDPSCAAVPEAPEDPCVRDLEADGHPGATVEAKAPLFPWVEIYVAQRNHPVLEGLVVDEGHIRGSVSMEEMTTKVLGASKKLFASTPKARFLPEKSSFQMVRLPSGAGCGAVLGAFGE